MKCVDCKLYDVDPGSPGARDGLCWQCSIEPDYPRAQEEQDHEPRGFAPTPLDYRRLIEEGIPPARHLEAPYVPADASIWAAGPAESGKSMWAMHTSARLSRAGIRVVYISQENPQPVELRRLERLGPDPGMLELYHYQGIDLAQPEHRGWLFGVCEGAGLVVLDTLTACWSGDENDNAALVAFDREVIRPVIGAGTTVLTLDHTGHAVPFTTRRGVSAPRGASSKGQKADYVLEFRDEGGHRFTIRHGKDRVTGTRQPDRTFEVVDTDEGLLDIVEVENAGEERVREVAEAMVAYVCEAGRPVGTNELREAMKGTAGKDTQTQAMRLLRAEDPLRLHNEWGHVETTTGRKRAKVWVEANRSEPIRNQSGTSSEGVPATDPNQSPIGTGRSGSPSLAQEGVTDPVPDRTPGDGRPFDKVASLLDRQGFGKGGP